MNAQASRKLCVFFTAGATRYALDATAVTQVRRQVSERQPGTVDLSALLGGEIDPRADATMTLDIDSSPTVVVSEVQGVFDSEGLPRWPMHGRLTPLIRPALPAALLFEGRLFFELDPRGVMRGLPKQQRAIERQTIESPSALEVNIQGDRLGLPMEHVRQVVEAGRQFNRAPNAGSFLGVAIHQNTLCPIFTVGTLGLVQPFVVLFELGNEILGLTVNRVEGVRQGAALKEMAILDLKRMFS